MAGRTVTRGTLKARISAVSRAGFDDERFPSVSRLKQRHRYSPCFLPIPARDSMPGFDWPSERFPSVYPYKGYRRVATTTNGLRDDCQGGGESGDAAVVAHRQ
jgi:hypothetical protein